MYGAMLVYKHMDNSIPDAPVFKTNVKEVNDE